MKSKVRNAVSGLALALGLLAPGGCADRGPQAPEGSPLASLPPSLQPGSVEIVNDVARLESRLVREERPLFVVSRDGGGASELEPAQKSADVGAELRLVGTVQAPVVDGNTVQANDVDILGNLAVVAYNFAGEVFAGALQVIDFRVPRRPVVVSEVIYHNAEVTAVALEGSHVYAGVAADDATLPTPAVLQELRLTASGGLEATGQWVQLPSWAVTDLAVQGTNVVAAVGAQNGGLALVRSSSTLGLASFVAATDVRGIAIDGNLVVCVSGGDATLQQHSLPDLGPLGATPVDGYRTLAAKGTIESYAHRSYLGAGEGGMQIRAADGGLLAQVRNDEWGNAGSYPAVVNAVTVEQHLAFVAAGPQGIQVADLGRYTTDETSPASDSGLRVLGQLALEDGASCNMVKVKNGLLVVAAGRGGVKLVEVDFTR